MAPEPIAIFVGGYGPVAEGTAEVKEFKIGDGVHDSFTLTHGLASPHPVVILINATTLAVESCTVVYNSEGTEVTLSAKYWEEHPPADDAYTVVVMG